MRLTGREKKLLSILFAILLLAISYKLIYEPLSSLRDSLKKRAFDSQSSSEELSKISSEINALRIKKQKYDLILNSNNDNILTVIQQKAEQNNIKDNLANIRSTPSNFQNKFKKVTTDFKIEGAPIQSIIKFIFDIENSGSFIVFESLTISKGLKGTDRYDASCKVNTFMADNK
ncbi:MAG: type II secretion system protein M [Spirochaetes bacterium]|nr:type II secretion system protein M [Spirochaetota bacterium]